MGLIRELFYFHEKKIREIFFCEKENNSKKPEQWVFILELFTFTKFNFMKIKFCENKTIQIIKIIIPEQWV